MLDFLQQINDFTSRGVYNYRFDEVGNLILNPLSPIFQQHFFAFQLRDVVYNNEKILSFYNPSFTEFQATTTASLNAAAIEMQQEIDAVNQQNTELQGKLDILLSNVAPDSTQSDQKQIKDVIIDLRVNLGQGKTSADFGTEFPYMPLNTLPSPDEL